MKIKFNNEEVFEFKDYHKTVIKNDIDADIFDQDMIRRAKWAIEHPLEQVIDRNRDDWRIELISRGIEFIPVDGYALYEALKGQSNLTSLQVFVDDKLAFVISPIQRKMIEEFKDLDSEKYCREKVQWILSHKYERCMERFRREWEPKLAKEMPNIPARDEAFANLVRVRPDYKDKKLRGE